MAIQKIEEIHLYVSDLVSAENAQAVAFMDELGVQYIQLVYYNAEQHIEVFNSLNTWWQDDPEATPITSFPFLTYVEVHDDTAERQRLVKNLQGINQIQTISNIINSLPPED